MVAASDGEADQVSGAVGTNRARGDAHLGGFVGRDRELNAGLTLIGAAASSAGQVLLICGEPGIGKSRLADELARSARDRGFQVAWGRCWEAGGAPAYWPWVQSLRSTLRTVNVNDLRAELGGVADAACQLLPELAGTERRASESLSQDPEAARFLLFDSVTAVLKYAAQRKPLMIVLDDLQVADTPSLLLLRFAAGLIDDDGVLIVATYRDIDPALGGALAETIGELMRRSTVTRLPLRGLAEADVPRFVEAVTGVLPRHQLARVVHRQTDGNPLFLTEVARVLLDEGSLAVDSTGEMARVPVPRTVRDVIARRLTALSDDSVHLLRLASVLGREFSIESLSVLAGLPLAEAIELLQRPLQEQLLTEVPESRVGLRFAHMVIRECLYDDIGRLHRAELHRRALHALEAQYGDDIEQHLSELAHHAYDGAGDGHWDAAIRYAHRAGDRALSMLAYEEAARLQRQALDSLERSHATDPELRCELLMSHGDALARAGDEAGAKASFLQAADLARALGRSDHLAVAALGYAGRHAWGRASGDTQLVPLLEDALSAVGEADTVLRVRLLARLAGALRDRAELEPRESFAYEAVAIARRLDDPPTLAFALDGLHGAIYRPDNLDERHVIAAEIVKLGELTGDRETQLWGHLDRMLYSFELGDLTAVREELAAIADLAGELRQPVLRWLALGSSVALAMNEGRLVEAERLVEATLEAGERSRASDALSAYAGQMFLLRREQGRLREVEHLLHRGAQEYVWYRYFSVMLAVTHLELGRESQARQELNGLAADGFVGLNPDNYWVFNMTLLGELASALGEVGPAAALYEQLLPYARRFAHGPPEGGLGSVSRVLGLLAATLERHDDACRHLEDALAQHQGVGAVLWVAHTQHDLAVQLLPRGTPERQRAQELLSDALRTCDEVGLTSLRKKDCLAARRGGRSRTSRRSPPRRAARRAFAGGRVLVGHVRGPHGAAP
ncbi:MAG: ATP-binding protein [Candidatus Dormibacteria bacterium]